MDNIDNEIWLNPMKSGGYGDLLLLSGVLKVWSEKYPDKKFHMVREMRLTNFFKGHPAIDFFSIPSDRIKAVIPQKTDPKGSRSYQVLSRFFGLETPIKEKLYFPEQMYDYSICRLVPYQKNKTVVIVSSTSKRNKEISLFIWEKVVRELRQNGFFVIQTGVRKEEYVKGAYSLIGLTSPCQLIPMIQESDYVITLDTFTMHIAEMLYKPTLVLWGPTRREVWGYDDHIHIYGLNDFGRCLHRCYENKECHCPIKPHCMDNITAELILEKFEQLLNNNV